MPVNTSPLDLAFGGGIDQKVRQERLQPGKFDTLQNLRVLKRGSYQKRTGFGILTRNAMAGGTIPAGTRLLSHKDELIQTDGLNLYSYSQNLFAWHQNKGYAPQNFDLRTQPVAPLQGSLQAYDFAYANGFYVVAYAMKGDGTIVAKVIDASNGTTVAAPAVVSGTTTFVSGSPPNIVLVAVGNVVVLVYSYDFTNSAGHVFGTRIDLSSSSTINTGWSAPINLATDGKADAGFTTIFDACSLGSTAFAISYQNNKDNTTNNDILSTRVFNSSLVQQAVATTTVKAGTASLTSVSVDGASDLFWVSCPVSNSAGAQVVGLQFTGLAIALAANRANVFACATAPSRTQVLRTGSTTGIVVAWNDTSVFARYRTFGITAGTVAGTAYPYSIARVIPVHRPFQVNGRLYSTVEVISDEGQLLLVDLTASLAEGDITAGYMRLVANPTPRLYQRHDLDFLGTGPRAAILSSTFAAFSHPTRQNAAAGAMLVDTMNFSAVNVAQSCDLVEDMAMSGPLPSYYDGVRSAEIGFAQRPDILQSSSSGAGTTGTFKYVAVFEQIDAYGQWHQSNISTPFSVTITNQGQITLTVSMLQVTNRADKDFIGRSILSPVRIAIYRATQNFYFRLERLEKLIDPLVASSGVTTITDNFTATEGAPLYSQPGIPNTAQPKTNPPPLTGLISHQDRVVGFNQKTIWFSGQAVQGEGPWFTDLFQFPVEEGGDITALASMDGALVIFKRNKIFFVDGQGPADNAAGGDFSSPQPISTDVGCINSRSVVQTSDGVIFQSLRGIELLTRARQLQNYFGNNVEDTINDNPVITSAVLNEAKGIVLFTACPTETSATGVTMTWDYVNGIWSTGTIGDGTTANIAIRSAVMRGSSPGVVPIYFGLKNTTTRTIHQELVGNYLDNSAWVTAVMTTPWYRVPGSSQAAGTGLVGLQMIIRSILLAQAATGHDLTIQIYYDYSSTPGDTRTWTAAQIASLATNREQLEVAFSQPECTAFKLRFSDATPSSGSVGTGQGTILIGTQFDGADQGILIPMAEANRK